jgi:hypothetical protein
VPTAKKPLALTAPAMAGSNVARTFLSKFAL